MTDVEVICAAKDLPEFIEVDLAEPWRSVTPSI